MSLSDVLKNWGIKSTKTPKEKIKEISEDYTGIVQSGDTNPDETIILEIMDFIKNSENPNETAKTMLEAVINSKKLPDTVTQGLSKQIVETQGISNGVVSGAVESSDANVPDDIIQDLLSNPESFSHPQRLVLIKNVDDPEKFKSNIKSELRKIYVACKNKRDDEVASSLKEILDLVKESSNDIDIISLIVEVIAHKMAENYYDDHKKHTKTFAFSQLLSYEELWENGIDDKVEQEYSKIELERGNKKGRFDKKEFRKMFLSDMGRNIGREITDLSETIVVPKSKKMADITEDELEKFFKGIENGCGEKLSVNKRRNIVNQIRGKTNDSTKEAIILKSIKEALKLLYGKKYEKYIPPIINEFSNINIMETIIQMEKAGLLKKLALIPSNQRNDVIMAIVKALEGKSKTPETPPKNDGNVSTAHTDVDDSGPGGNR